MLEGLVFRDDWLTDADGRRWSAADGSTCMVAIPPDKAATPDGSELAVRFQVVVRQPGSGRCCRLRVTVNDRMQADRLLYPAEAHTVVVALGREPGAAVRIGFRATEIEDPVWDAIAEAGPSGVPDVGPSAAIGLAAVALDLQPVSDRHKRMLIAAGEAASRSLFPERLHRDGWSNAADLATLITDAVASRTPLSVIRLGDGEGRVLGYPLLLSERETEEQTIAYMFGPQAFQSLQRRFGPGALAYGMATLRRLILEAVGGADAIGLPTPVHFVRFAELTEGPDRAARMNGIVGMAGALIFSAKHMAHIPPERLFDTYVFFALHLTGKLETILRGAEFVGLVAHTDFRAELSRRFAIRQMDHIRIPGHKTFTPGSSIHFPDGYEEIVARIRVPFRGAMFLVAAGYLGKIYCHVIKARGGIAIDLGSIFDAWFGVGRHKTGNNPAYLLEARS